MRAILITILLTVAALFLTQPCFAASQPLTPQTSYAKGEVVTIQKQGIQSSAAGKNLYQDVKIHIDEGADKGKTVSTEYGGDVQISKSDLLKVGDIVVLQKTSIGSKSSYSIIDKYRLDIVMWLAGGFLLLVLLVAGRKGAGSIAGMIISLFVIMMFIVPQILAGRDPLFISIIGAFIIMIITIYLAHGFSKQTTVAVLSTAIVLAVTGFLAFFFVHLAQLNGSGNEEAAALQFGTNINLQGLLLGGIIIGALGVLDDVTTAQVAAIFEVYAANPHVSFTELVKKGHRIGKEHIASLVNTLVLAYAGASLALFIFFILNPGHQPYWVIFNSQTITEEVVRTLAGSIGLVLAVPLSTALAAWFASSNKKRNVKT